MIAKCPPFTDPTLRKLCEDPRPSADPFADNIPVTDYSQQGSITTYRNTHCAKCNNASLASKEFWTPLVQCYDNIAPDIPTEGMTLRWNATAEEWIVVANGTDLFFHCSIDFSAPSEFVNFVRSCREGGFVDECLAHWNNTYEERMCRSYTAYVVFSSVSYRNVFCAKCNDINVTTVDCVDITQWSGGRSATFSNLLKVSDADREECKKTEIYDSIFGKCRALFCPPGKEGCEIEDNSVSKDSNVSSIEDCFIVFLDKGTFKILDNGTVWVEKYTRYFTEAQYLVNDKGQVGICKEDVPEEGTDRYSNAMSILTVAGLGISIFFLLLHLCATALVPELRNHSGMNLSSLCVALLGAYISFIAGAFLSGTPGDTPLQSCATVAVLTYFFFLSAFFWMLVIAFDVWRVLRGAVRHFRMSSGRQYCRFFAYSLLSWGLPALLTLTALLVETAPQGAVDDRFRPRFGSESCWFSRRLSLIAFFATPLAVIMALNVIFFVSSAFMASSSRLASATSNVSGHQRDFRLYLRLAILLGLTWVIGLLAAVMDYEPLWICFVLFNTLQGLFIFAVFTCTTKVFNGLTKNQPWANRLRGSLKLPPAKPTRETAGSDVGLSRSTTDTTINKSSGNSTSVEMGSQAQGCLPPSRKSSTNLEVTSPSRRL